jgi:hypothetical protein
LQRKPAGPAVQAAIARGIAGIGNIVIQLAGKGERPDRIEGNIAKSLAEITGDDGRVVTGIDSDP